jgi:hypothetical protein
VQKQSENQLVNINDKYSFWLLLIVYVYRKKANNKHNRMACDCLKTADIFALWKVEEIGAKDLWPPGMP